MPSQRAVELIQKIRLTCGSGVAGRHKECLRELERIVMELDEERTNLRAIAMKIMEKV